MTSQTPILLRDKLVKLMVLRTYRLATVSSVMINVSLGIVVLYEILFTPLFRGIPSVLTVLLYFTVLLVDCVSQFYSDLGVYTLKYFLRLAFASLRMSIDV